MKSRSLRFCRPYRVSRRYSLWPYSLMFSGLCQEHSFETKIRDKNSKIKNFWINNWDNFRKYFPTPRVRKIMYIAPTIIYFLGYLAIRISPCGKIDTFLGFAAMGISNGVLLTSSSKPIPNELGGKFAGQVYAYTNTICNIGSLVCKRLK